MLARSTLAISVVRPYPSSPKEYCAEAMPVPKQDAPANTINASFVILASHER